MKQKPKPKKLYSWTVKDGKINCFVSQTSKCTVSGLWEADELTGFHDAELAKARKEISAILNEIEKGNKDPERELSFIQFRDRHFLVWAGYGVVGPEDDEKKIMKALRLK